MVKIETCVYCGVIADTVDHVVPKHLLLRAESLSLDLSSVYRIKKWELPACKECNSGITGQLFTNLKDRRKCAHDHIKKKYCAYLRIPNWTQEEIQEMGPEFQRDLKIALRIRDQTKERLAYRGSAIYAVELSSVYELFRSIVNQDVKIEPTGNED